MPVNSMRPASRSDQRAQGVGEFELDAGELDAPGQQERRHHQRQQPHAGEQPQAELASPAGVEPQPQRAERPPVEGAQENP